MANDVLMASIARSQLPRLLEDGDLLLCAALTDIFILGTRSELGARGRPFGQMDAGLSDGKGIRLSSRKRDIAS